MPSPLDPSLLETLPAELRKAVEAQIEALAAKRAARLHLDAENADPRFRNAEPTALNARPEPLARELKRARFGPRSGKLNADRLELAFEDLETAMAEAQETHDASASTCGKVRSARPPRGSRALPKDLPREERVIEPESLTWSPSSRRRSERRWRRGCGDMVRIGEDRLERLDIIPAQFRAIVTIRPRYACPKGRAGVVQGEPSCAIGSRTMASAPPALIEGGLPTEATITHVLVSKYSEHLPLYRQAQVMARHGTARALHRPLDTGRLGVGRAAFHLAPVVDRMAGLLKRSGKLFMDGPEGTVAPVAPRKPRRTPRRCSIRAGAGRRPATSGRCCGMTGRRTEGAPPAQRAEAIRPGWSSPAPRGGAVHAERMPEGGNGILQVDGYGGYNRLADDRRERGDPLRLACCWAHARREIIKATPKADSPIAVEALRRIAALYGIEKEIRGLDPERRQAMHQDRSVPLLDDLETWLRARAARLSRKSEPGKAVAYFLTRWGGLTLFAEDGRIEMDSNLVENQIRPLVPGRKNALFAGMTRARRTGPASPRSSPPAR